MINKGLEEGKDVRKSLSSCAGILVWFEVEGFGADAKKEFSRHFQCKKVIL